MRILHIIRKKGEVFPMDVITQHRTSEKVDVLLIHDAVFLYDGIRRQADSGLKAYVCKDDLIARGMTPDAGALTYQQIVSLIWENDHVVCW